jgi:hypothetical protein
MSQQIQVRAHDTHLTCWVDKKVAVGNWITFKHAPAIMWEVLWAGEPTDFTPNRGWNVGGL